MNVLVLATAVPFIHGGAEELAKNLVLQLNRAGSNAEAMWIPFSWDPPDRLIDEILIARSLRVTNVDRLITFKFPAYLVEHPAKTVWLLHQYRQAYDLFDARQSNIPRTSDGSRILNAVRNADRHGLSNVRRLFANSPVTADRLGRYNNLAADVLLPPVNDPELFAAAPSAGYVLAYGRINIAKRQHLIVEAVAKAPGVRLVVAGPPDTPADGARLIELVGRLNLADRVHLYLELLPRPQLAKFVNEAQAVAYLPFDEDSLGYVTMEACLAARPVITTTDAGGVLGLVHDGVTGWVCDPTPEALAGALASAADSARSAKRGKAAFAALRALNLSWELTIERLLT